MIKLIKILSRKYNPKKEPNNFIKIGKALFLVRKDFIETLFMIKMDGSIYFCVSSQLGCPVGCKFCINSPKNFNNNLSSKEILSQIYLLLNNLKISINKTPFIGVMFSGCGEPSLNYKNVIYAIKELNKFKNCKVSITTVCTNLNGLDKLINAKIDFGLQISLHGYNNKIRKKIIPSSTSIKEIFKVCEEYYKKKRRIIDLNYLVIKNKNDSFSKIIDFFSKLDSNQYSIRFSKLNKCNRLKPGDKKKINYMINLLKKKGFYVRYFESSAEDLIAGCGQLKNNFIKDTL